MKVSGWSIKWCINTEVYTNDELQLFINVPNFDFVIDLALLYQFNVHFLNSCSDTITRYNAAVEFDAMSLLKRHRKVVTYIWSRLCNMIVWLQI